MQISYMTANSQLQISIHGSQEELGHQGNHFQPHEYHPELVVSKFLKHQPTHTKLNQSKINISLPCKQKSMA